MSLRAQFTLQRRSFALHADFELPLHGITGISGPSGSGKTSLLRAIAGLEPINGLLHCANRDFSALPPRQRQLGYVFQEPRLFPHLTVQQNLHYAARRARHPFSLSDISSWLELDPLLARYPHQLSGGQRQRAALARSIIARPSLLLLDEPLANLDHGAKQLLLQGITHLAQQLSLPMLYISHAISELAALCDRILLIEPESADRSSARRVLPAAEALTSFDGPLAFARDQVSVLQARVLGYDSHYHLTELGVGAQRCWLAEPGLTPGSLLRLRIHARDISLALCDDTPSSIQNRLRGTVTDIRLLPDSAHCLVALTIDEQPILARITHRARDQLALAPGQTVIAQVKAVALA